MGSFIGTVFALGYFAASLGGYSIGPVTNTLGHYAALLGMFGVFTVLAFLDEPTVTVTDSGGGLEYDHKRWHRPARMPCSIVPMDPPSIPSTPSRV
ncbi:MAG TPA: hypothetical protein QF873_02640 [Patescibacteria group bacterium]|nr:hypothetical protein [Patescibacteria group bacterium]